ncbi:hypothetical protein HW555_011901 [Spodoptera exigua]|uniref:C2H2-type domain-containing protein n=1 Tax=Spodoptera exigua TaxID=7107 RepID=A0A835G636_SPOEX|nr:hypothetical protein HW555_011901 [Spodoptera exigua]
MVRSVWSFLYPSMHTNDKDSKMLPGYGKGNPTPKVVMPCVVTRWRYMMSYVMSIIEQAINIQALSALTPDDVKDIIPQTGPRVLFMRCWKAWKAEFLCINSSLPNLDLSDLEFGRDPVINISLAEEKENVPTSNVENFIIVNENVPPNSGEIEQGTQSGLLERILLKSLDTSSLLIYKGGTLDGDSTRNLLASAIAREILSENKNSTIVGPIYFKWANLIKEVFPGERTTTYYIPACTTASGAVLQARGKLVHQVLNKRRRLQQLGALPTKVKRSREESPAPSSSPRPLPVLLCESHRLDENVEDDLQWLRNSSEPWSLVEIKWKNTFKYRVTLLHKNHNDQTLESYINEYPALRKPLGYTLLNIDFEAAYRDQTNNLFVYFPVAKIKILDLLRKRKTKDNITQELISIADCESYVFCRAPKEEDKNLAAFLAIPHLLNTTPINRKRKQKKPSCSWKPSKVETRDAFIKHLRSDAEISQSIELRLKTLENKGATSQPYIIIVGESLNEIKTYLVVVNKSVIYHRVNIIQAVDTCYKAIWALNAEYGSIPYSIWFFIQRGLYKMNSQYDRVLLYLLFTMVICFVCRMQFLSIKILKSHFGLVHSTEELRVFVCVEDDCNRQFQLFNSFRRHVLQKHKLSIKTTDNALQPFNTKELEFDHSIVNSDIDQLQSNASSDSSPLTTSLQPLSGQEMVERAFSNLVASLYANQSLPRNVVQTIINGYSEFMAKPLALAIAKELEMLSSNNTIPKSSLKTVVNTVKPLLTNPLTKLDTEYKRLEYFRSKNTYIQPETIVVGERLERVKRSGISRILPITCEQHFIPLRKSVLSETIDYMRRLNRVDNDVAIENFIQGSFWRNRMNQRQGKIVIPIFIFFDDYEIGNPLGSRAGQHKLGAVYASIPCLAPCHSSALRNIFLLLLFHSSDRVVFGNNVIFNCVIEELNYLSLNGIEFDLPDFTGVVHFELGLILGDNLGIHAISGFVESFSANYSCRVCKVPKQVMKTQCFENKEFLRTLSNYESDLRLGNPSETAFAKGTEGQLQAAVTELNTMYLSLTKDSLKPKFHNLVHYHTALEKYGPIISLWSMRFEAKHRIFKMASNASCNRRNIALSLAMKHQLQLNDFFLKAYCPTFSELVLFLVLVICQRKSLVQVTWATVSTTRYAKGTILVYDTSPDDLLPVFFKVQNVFLYDSNSLILMGQLLQTLEFDEHFFAYVVQEPEAKQNVVKFLNSFSHPIPCNINILSNSKKYVTLRNTL